MELQLSAPIHLQVSLTRTKFRTQAKSKSVNWHKLMAKLAIWAASELLLGWVGLDNLADYGEFVLGESVLGNWGQDAESALYQVQPKPQASLGVEFRTASF